MKIKLSKLNKINLRDAWEHEAFDFTNWLAKKENIETLSEELGIDIKIIRTEASVGHFNVDILAEEEISGQKIIIENQLENTDHDHLGKIITYASGHNAEIIIWIVKNAQEEHRQAVEWLNEHTDKNINFFLIKIELWQIDNSSPAPKFDILVGPNEWSKAIKDNQNNNKLTDTNLKQLDFWTKFRDYIQQKNQYERLQKPRPKSWYSLRVGSSEGHIDLSIVYQKKMLYCEFYIRQNKELFNFLKQKKDKIEKELGQTAEWIDAPIISSIRIKKEVADVFDQDKFDNYFSWLYEKATLFQKLFNQEIKDFKNNK